MSFKNIFDIEIPYFYKKRICLTIYNRNGVYEMHIQTIERGIKDCKEYRNDWFIGDYHKRIVFKMNASK